MSQAKETAEQLSAACGELEKGFKMLTENVGDIEVWETARDAIKHLLETTETQVNLLHTRDTLTDALTPEEVEP